MEEQSEGWTKQCLMKQNAKNMIKFSINDAKTSDVILQYKKIFLALTDIVIPNY